MSCGIPRPQTGHSISWQIVVLTENLPVGKAVTYPDYLRIHMEPYEDLLAAAGALQSHLPLWEI